MGGSITIRLEVYLPFRGRSIWRGEEAVPASLTAGALAAHMALAEPELAVLVNGRQVPDETPLVQGDAVAVLRQSEGGD